MTLRRAVLYVAGATLLIAWFSSAASVSLQRASRSTAAEGATRQAPAEDLAAGVQAQAQRLRKRLAAAPVPQQPSRNPFTFRTAPARTRPAEPAAVMPVAALPERPSEPVLLLIGIAEQKRGDGLVRIAMVATAAEDLILAAVGDTILERYTVTAIAHDTAELTDRTTGQLRRISLQ